MKSIPLPKFWLTKYPFGEVLSRCLLEDSVWEYEVRLTGDKHSFYYCEDELIQKYNPQEDDLYE